jgi:hypothetical protein
VEVEVVVQDNQIANRQRHFPSSRRRFHRRRQGVEICRFLAIARLHKLIDEGHRQPKLVLEENWALDVVADILGSRRLVEKRLRAETVTDKPVKLFPIVQMKEAGLAALAFCSANFIISSQSVASLTKVPSVCIVKSR